MFVCMVKIRLHIYGAQSLKEKRRVIKSLLEKTRRKFNLTVAEVGDYDIWQSSYVGIALVGNSKRLLEREMEKVLAFMECNSDAEFIEVHHEIWSFD